MSAGFFKESYDAKERDKEDNPFQAQKDDSFDFVS